MPVAVVTSKKGANQPLATPSRAEQAEANYRLALDLARKGFNVFPLNSRTRKPCIKEWQKKASTNLADIRAWWSEHKGAAPAIHCAGLGVLDVDQKNGKDGFATLDAMGLDGRNAHPTAATSHTPSGGMHYIFRSDEDVRNTVSGARNAVGTGLDTKGRGGFIVAPGAWVGNDKRAQYIPGRPLPRIGELPELPDAFRPKRASVATGTADDFEPTGLPLDVLHEAFMAIPLDVREEKWGSNGDWFVVGRAVYDETAGSREGNELWHDWSQGWGGYDFDEAEAVWNRDGRSYDGQRATVWPLIREAERHGFELPIGFGYTVDELFDEGSVEPKSNVIYLDNVTEAEYRELVGEPPENLRFADDTKTKVAAALKLFNVHTMGEAAQLDPVPYLVKELIGPEEVGAIVAAPGAGKSNLGPELAHCVASGRPFFGRKCVIGPVLYIAAESQRKFLERIAAVRQVHGEAPIYTAAFKPDFLNNESHVEALLAVVRHYKPALVLIDTLAASFTGLKESDSEEMGKVIEVARAVTKCGSTCILIAHDNAEGSGRIRGHTSVTGDLDFALGIKVSGKTRTVWIGKNRHGEDGIELGHFEIEGVKLEGKFDVDGDPIKAPILRISGAPEAKGVVLNGAKRVVWDQLHEMAQGKVDVRFSREALGQRCIAAGISNGKNPYAVFRARLGELIRDGHLGGEGRDVWLPGLSDD